MTFTNRFVTLSEFGRKFLASLDVYLSKGAFTLFLTLLFSLSCNPATLLAEDKQPGDTKKSEPAKTAEGLLASTEQIIEQMIMKIDFQKESTTEATELAENPNPTSFFSSIPNIKPVIGAISSAFGARVHPIYNVTLFHSGIDISASEGTRVQTTGDGIVAFSGYDKGYGQKITINHGYGYKTIYAHLSKSLVRQGQKVKRGDIIALSGNTGVSTGPHLHYEVLKDNVKVNPTAYFFDETNPDKFITTQKTEPDRRDNNS
ncbi:MAG: M23 family metallopeptidase [Chlorobiaceae bacterium]